MKNRIVNIDNTSIQLVDSISELNDGIVMNEVAKPLTREFCKIVGTTQGDILDIGFGLGFSAQYFVDLNVKSYTCIEINDEIYLKALDWAKGKPQVTILKGDWIDILPSLTSKFDGIFMDTYGDDLDKYGLFEQYAKDVAKEGCILAMWEYSKVRPLKDLNYKEIPIHQNNYKLLLKPFHKVCWTYYFAGKFRKKLFYKKQNVIPETLCNQIIAENQDGYEEDYATAVVDGIEHTRRVWIKDLKDNKELFKLIEKYVYPNYAILSSDNLYFCKIIKYTEGCKHDRHLESDKYSDFLSPDQYRDSIIITLNNDFEGGEFLVYDSWVRDNRSTFSNTKTTTGDLITFKPYQHCTTTTVVNGTKYEVFIKVKNKELVLEPKTII